MAFYGPLFDHPAQQENRILDTKKLIGARLKELRKQAGLTQETLAEDVGLDARHLSRLEVGKHFPSLDSRQKIADALNVPLVEFFQFPSDESPAALRAYVTRFVKGANVAQLRLAVKAIKLVVT